MHDILVFYKAAIWPLVLRVGFVVLANVAKTQDGSLRVLVYEAAECIEHQVGI